MAPRVGGSPISIRMAHRLERSNTKQSSINQLAGVQHNHYMLSMSDPNNIVSLADWKAKHERNQPNVQPVPVYVPVRDPDGRWRLELTGTTTLEPELHFYVDPS